MLKAYNLLAGLKRRGDSFSTVIHRHVRPPANACGELMERVENYGPPDIDEKVLEIVTKQRGRRNNRK